MNLSYLKNCIQFAWNSSVDNALNWAGILGIGLAGMATSATGIKMPIDNTWSSTVLVGVISAATAWIVIFAFRAIFVAPYSLWKEAQRKIYQLDKVDRSDLEKLLYGFFIEDTFVYKAEVTICREFKGRVEIEELVNNFVEIPVRAPKKALANIRIQFFSNRLKSKADYGFYFLDTRNKPTLIQDLYHDQPILLDDNACFSIKLMLNDNYEIHDDSTLRITITSWKK